ncbi:GHKL domain-containing protein [Paenibacillus sp. 1011MAR3C5]|uniref:sensor histidine kinase n=1 Tax=Paenibacillus sp. 1011MAR3C5 TaxID=1675787 RepID=UPI000E6CA24E|nr:sensor histidine kinase [Paenibacillus sp. 1011MAR3C5]RJE88706.1 GHKL domain-containing protein [Paenibacillus sp. 1011MAR3C5]
MAQIPFKVSARTARLIGRENVSNADGAIIELIKNSYDAGASACVVYFDFHPENIVEENSIYIIDNGIGMDRTIIENYWMTIGTNNKEVNFIGEDGRVKSGAKGIGRFALDRLGSKAEMITKPKSKGETFFWSVDWNDFDNIGVTIEEVYADIDVVDNMNFHETVFDILKGTRYEELLKDHNFNNGTIIRIKVARDPWEDYFVDRISTNLEFLVPIDDNSQFELILLSSEFPEKYGLINSLLNYDYDYKLHAKVNSDNSVKISYHRNEFDPKIIDMDLFQLEEMMHYPYTFEVFENGKFEKLTTVNKLMPNYEKKYNKGVLNSLGNFEFTMYFLKRNFSQGDRKKFYYRYFDVGKRNIWMDTFAGIKVYRDHFRVRPYGEMGGSSFDWLMLGERAAKSPAAPSHKSGSWRVRPNQISGSISISRLDNINLEDKSSREGFQENVSFMALKDLVLKIIQEFETDRQYVMRALDKLYTNKNIDEQEKKRANQIAKQIVSKIDNNVSEEKLNQLISKDSKSAENVGILAKSYLAQLKTNKDLISELQLLRALASTGLTLTSFAHDLNNLSANIVQRNINLKKIISRLINEEEVKNLQPFLNPLIVIDDMAIQDERLKKWLEFSLNTIKVDKRTRKKIELYKYFEEFSRTWESVLNFQKVKLTVPTSTEKKCFLRIFEIDFDSIFNNLISNSLTAFRRPDADDERTITIELIQDSNEIIIDFTDSGPGLSSDIDDPNKIFEAFYTTKRDELGKEIGTGLGMWIIKSTVEEYKGNIKIKRPRPGLSIQFVFPTRKDEGVTENDE